MIVAPRFEYVRVERPEDLPPPDRGAVDVAVLDMNHGLPNVGHDAVLALLADIAVEMEPQLTASGRRLRATSYAVRHRLMVPHHDGRHRLYLGTGGPGHLDPRHNREDRGEAEIREDPAWETPLWELFDAIAADREAALYGVCHTFGLLCRWAKVAEPVKRGPHKGGKASGVGAAVLTAEALAHPWFGRLAEALGPAALAPVLDSRHYDMIPRNGSLPAGVVPIAHEASADGSGPGDALTMVEFARERADAAPRIFAVNSHPEIGAADRVAGLLERMLARGAISAEFHASRSAMLPMLRDERSADRLLVARAVFEDLARTRIERLALAA